MIEVNSKIGEKHITNEGYEVEVIEYNNSIDCSIQFKNGTILKNLQYGNIKRGQIKNPYHPSVFVVGYFGVGNYKAKINNKNTEVYNTWCGMLRRCYDSKYHMKRPTYIGCSVHPDWHNFQVFAEWFEENYIEGYQLDKDILIKNNKIYSPETCCFVPSDINNIFTKSDKRRGEYPIGVSYNIKIKKFISSLRINSYLKYLGIFNTSEQAFQAYKIAKELYIKEVAELWKTQITKTCYQALINYQVEITD